MTSFRIGEIMGEPTESSSARIGRQEKFRKVLSFWDIYFISLGGTIGSAWLFGSVYGAAAAGPAATLSWILGGIFVIFIALTWAEIGGMLPSTGAVVRAPQYAHGYFTGFYFGWTYYISAVAIPPVEAIAIVTYASAYVPALIKDGVLTVQGYAVGVSIMVFAFLLNSFGVRLLRFNTGITVGSSSFRSSALLWPSFISTHPISHHSVGLHRTVFLRSSQPWVRLGLF